MRKGVPASGLAVVLAATLVALSVMTGTAAAKGHGHEGKKCKGAKVAVTVNGKSRCTLLKKALPAPMEADQNLASAQQALGTELKGLRDRHGRKIQSARGVLGANGVKKLEGAVRTGLTLAEKLKAARAFTLSVAPPPTATASSVGGCTPLPFIHAPKSGQYKSGGLSGSVDLSNGSAQLGIEGGPNGLRVELNLRICEKGGLKLPGCPEADGRLDGTDEDLMSMDLKVFQGNEQVFGQSFGFKTRTVIEPVQVDDNAKLEYFEIDHKYTEDASNNGVSIHFAYHGHARVTYPGANYDPHGTDVEARASVAGVSNGDEELSAAEFDLGYEAKPKADVIFANEVEKVIKSLGNAEAGWMQPNTCAKIAFTPDRNTLKPLKKGQKGSFQAKVESKDGGTPTETSWTVLKQANGSFNPTTAHPNPASFNYTVIDVGDEVFIEVNLRVVSAAGVAERDWIQPTEPDEINQIKGTFTQREDKEGSIVEWSGEATYNRLVPGVSGAGGVYLHASGTVTGVFSGFWGGGGSTCGWEGEKTYSLQPEDAVTAIEVSPGSLEPPYQYTIEATVRSGPPGGIKVLDCDLVTEWEAPIDMDFETGKAVSDDGVHFSGSTTDTSVPGWTIEKTWSFEGTK
jgi:hypothetical protein